MQIVFGEASSHKATFDLIEEVCCVCYNYEGFYAKHYSFVWKEGCIGKR
jgi:hypothetical protein